MFQGFASKINLSHGVVIGWIHQQRRRRSVAKFLLCHFRHFCHFCHLPAGFGPSPPNGRLPFVQSKEGSLGPNPPTDCATHYSLFTLFFPIFTNFAEKYYPLYHSASLVFEILHLAFSIVNLVFGMVYVLSLFRGGGCATRSWSPLNLIININ